MAATYKVEVRVMWGDPPRLLWRRMDPAWARVCYGEDSGAEDYAFIGGRRDWYQPHWSDDALDHRMPGSGWGNLRNA